MVVGTKPLPSSSIPVPLNENPLPPREQKPLLHDQLPILTLLLPAPLLTRSSYLHRWKEAPRAGDALPPTVTLRGCLFFTQTDLKTNFLIF